MEFPWPLANVFKELRACNGTMPMATTVISSEIMGAMAGGFFFTGSALRVKTPLHFWRLS